MHDEVFEAAQDAGSLSRDAPGSAGSSPSEAYANLSLESREPTDSMTAQSDQAPPKPPPRSSSPAKRPHSDMDDTTHADPSSIRRGSGQSSPRPTKPLPAASQRSVRATSVEMTDAPANSASTASSETASVSNTDTAATSMSTQSTPPHRSAKVPSLDDQVGKVMAIHTQLLSDGQEGYVISERWLARVFARTSENKNNPEQFDKAAVEGDIGPVDNSDLVDADVLVDDLSDQNGEDFVPLRPGLTMGQDFEVLPAEAWELIISWYGLKESTPIIRRYVHNTAFDESENLQYEIYPCIFTIRKVRKANSTQGTPKRGAKLVASRSDSFVEFLRAAKKAAEIPIKTKVRVWRVLSTAPTDQAAPRPSGILTPESSPQPGSPVRNQSCPLIIEEAAFVSLAASTERELVTGKDETANEKYNGHMNLQIAGLAEDQVLILEEQDDNGEYLTESTKKKNGSLVKVTGKADKGLQSATNSGRSSPAPYGMMTRGRTRNGRTRGTVGLTNLGNTCYMNSALQCIRSVEELSVYFLDQKYKRDLNADNPLGHGGSIAKTYGSLLESIYNVEGTSSFSPKAFKLALGRAQPLFSGYGQQDSQEFLSFLVDGLHEDLNRIKKKPYIENPESDDNTVHDPEAIKALGEKFRDIHRSRNDSVAMDLFNGFYKNTMVCPECDKVSITFDPYSLLTLQLPIEQTWQHTITFVPLQGRPVNVEIDIDKNATIKGVKEYVAQRFPGVKSNRLMGAEVYSHKFYRVLDDHKSIVESTIGQRDVIFFYELEAVPTNWPPQKKKTEYRSILYPSMSSEEDVPKSASPLADTMLVPIFHRKHSSSSYRGSTWGLALTPSYIILTREEAKDELIIWKKVLAKVAQMTTRPILTELNDTRLHEQSRSGSDVVLTTEEDAASNGDSRIQDGSVEGEDMVEVTMTEPAESNNEQVPDDDVPQVLKPGTFIPSAFRSLFEIKHTKAGKEMVPTGWSSIDANKPFEPLAKRIRASASRQSSVHSLDGGGNSATSSSDADDDAPQFSVDAQSSIDLANQSSEEEMQSLPSIETESFSRGGRTNSKKNLRKNKKNQKNQKRGQVTYSKKGKGRFSRQTSQVQSDLESDDEEGLLRLGEALVLDWTTEAYEALFDGVLDGNDERGTDTLNDIETINDPELEAKKAKRAARKKNGITLEECFAETSKSEVLSEDNAWYCSRCKELRRATKTLEIWTVPDILVVHLKRFSAHRTFRDKIEALVDCPLEGLDLSGKVGLPEDKGLTYDLFAVDNHYGGLGGGHYTASARNFFDGKWYDYNDSHVSSRSPDKVVTPSAYLLFYRRRSDVPLGPPYLQEIAESFRNPGSNDAGDDDDSDAPKSRNTSRSPAGNGSRLDGLSRNGSSSAFGPAAGALRGGGSTLAGSLQLKGAAAGTADADDQEMLLGGQQENLPGYVVDEGYADDDEDDRNFNPVNLDTVYGPLYNQTRATPGWSFHNLDDNQETLGDDENDDAFDDDAASDAPNLGSRAGNDLDERMLEDFGDELSGGVQGLNPGLGTPLEEEVPSFLGGELGDGEVADVVLDDEVGVDGQVVGRIKLD